MQTGQTMRQPCNGIRFAGPGAVLNEIIFAGPILAHIVQQLGHHIQLVIARENHAFGLNLAGLFIPLDFQMQILMQDFQQTILRQHILPQIGSIISVGIRRIACAAHIARALVEMGAVNTMQQAFDRYLARGKCAYIARRYMSIADGVSLLANAGATVVLAHPCRLCHDPQGLRALVTELMDAGLSGLEAYHPSASRQQAPLIDSMARSLGLLVTGGSDYHGDPNCCVRMGRMPSGWKDPEADLQALLERIRKA